MQKKQQIAQTTYHFDHLAITNAGSFKKIQKL